MSTSIFLAQAFSIYLIVLGLAMLLKRKRFLLVVDELIASPASLFIVAVLTLILGIILVLSHNIWVANWPVVITILSWLTLLAGVFRTFFPELIIKFAKNIHHMGFYYTVSIVSLALGGYLGCLGFIRNGL